MHLNKLKLDKTKKKKQANTKQTLPQLKSLKRFNKNILKLLKIKCIIYIYIYVCVCVCVNILLLFVAINTLAASIAIYKVVQI